jgi:hypothetical protein
MTCTADHQLKQKETLSEDGEGRRAMKRTKSVTFVKNGEQARVEINLDVRDDLIATAKARGTKSYGELMKQKTYRIPRGHPTPGIGIGHVVGNISEFESSKGRPLLSAIAVRAETELPGGGFFGQIGIPKHLRRPESLWGDNRLTPAEMQFVIEEQKRVWDYWNTHEDTEAP